MNKPLTKSLHTVTAVTNVARLLAADGAVAGSRFLNAEALAAGALSVLGYTGIDADDPTLAACVKAISRAGLVTARQPRPVTGFGLHEGIAAG